MSEAGLPGMGLKLGAELLRGPNGIWFSATAADGSTLGVLRFEPDKVRGQQAVDRLVERVVAARAGLLPGVLPVVDLVEDAGRIWFITSAVPVAESAGRTEALLLGPAPAPPPPPPQPQGVPVQPAGVWRPAVDLSSDGYQPAADSGDLAWTPADTDGRHSGLRAGTVLIGVLLVGLVIGAAAVGAMMLKDKGGSTALQISGIAVKTTAAQSQTTPKALCTAALPMTAELTTNGGTGGVDFEWELPNGTSTRLYPGHQQVSGASTQTIFLTWDLQLHGRGTVVAKFRIKNAAVLAAGTSDEAEASYSYDCP